MASSPYKAFVDGGRSNECGVELYRDVGANFRHANRLIVKESVEGGGELHRKFCGVRGEEFEWQLEGIHAH